MTTTETNGVPGRIHVSETTANLLLQAGKSSWLTKRQVPIEAKGKGTLQTWWCEVQTGTGSVGTSTLHTTSSVSDQDEGVPELVPQTLDTVPTTDDANDLHTLDAMLKHRVVSHHPKLSMREI